MPITQTRLLAVIEAAEHFQSTSSTLRDFFNYTFRQIATGEITHSQALTQIDHEFNSAVPYDAKAASIIMGERVRYNLTHKRNSLEKRRIYNKRHASEPSAPSQFRPPPRTIAEAVAAVDATDEALDGLSSLTDEAPHSPPTPLPNSDYFSTLDPATKAALDAEIAKLSQEPHK